MGSSDNGDSWRKYLDLVKNVLTMEEESAFLPSSAKGLKSHMEQALAEGGKKYGDTSDPEADRFRHVMGMRRAAMDPDVGANAAWFGGLGHELNNLRKSILGGDITQLGSPASRLGLMQILENSADDVVNNFWGILSSFTHPESLTEEELLSILERANLPVDLRRPDASAVMIPSDPGAAGK